MRDVVAVVHIGEHTLSKRLYEFSSTSASAYTADEFEERVKQIEADETERLEAAQPVEPVGLLESTGCEHLREWRPAAGVCDVRGPADSGSGHQFMIWVYCARTIMLSCRDGGGALCPRHVPRLLSRIHTGKHSLAFLS